MQFVHQALTWGFLLALVPLLIHLINMMRHQRVQWAAMEFLLRSYKKHRKWIWLKQLLLLLMRMAAVALIVAMLAQWVTRDQWLDLFGGKTTHHFILVDDSYSMSERAGGASAYDQARQVVARIAQRAAAADQPQKLTLIRFSQAAKAQLAATAKAGGESGAAAGATPKEEPAGDGSSDEKSDAATKQKKLDDLRARIASAAEFNAEIVDSEFDVRIEERRSLADTTQLSVGPGAALQLARDLVEQDQSDEHVLYVLTDFRANNWDNPAESADTLRRIEKAGAEVHLIACSKAPQNNLGVVAIEPDEGTRAAGVPLFVNLSVKNYGPDAAKRVQLKVRSIYYAPEQIEAGEVDQASGAVDELPTLVFDDIKAGETATRRVQVFFPKPGQHVVEASLAEDAIASDNRRWTVIDFPEGEQVLLIDGSADQRHSFYVAAAFAPGQRANTGVRPTVKEPAYLRDVAPQELGRYRSIYLLDVPRLDDSAISALEQYARGGGGVAFFMGDDVGFKFYNDKLYRGGKGIFPVPIDRADALPEKTEESAADIEPLENPVFNVFLGETNSFIRLVAVEKYLRISSDWKPGDDSTATVMARLRNRAPLAVEQRFGDGRVVAFLTSAAPQWNNWAQDPSFIVMQLKLQAYLTAGKYVAPPRMVGQEVQVQLPVDKYRKDYKSVSPGTKASTRVVQDRVAERPQEKSPFLVAEAGAAANAASGSDTDRSGVYEVWSMTAEGRFEARRFAVNVDATDGEVALAESNAMLGKLALSRPQFQFADQFEADLSDLGGLNRSLFLMALLVLLLVGEQLMAYFASFHPAPIAAGMAAVAGAKRRVAPAT